MFTCCAFFFFNQLINKSIRVGHIEFKDQTCRSREPWSQPTDELCIFVHYRQSQCLRTFSPGAGCTHRRCKRLHEEEIMLLPSSLQCSWGFWGPELPSFDFDYLINEQNTSGPSFPTCICSNAKEEALLLLPAVLLLPLSELWHEPPVLWSRLWW